MATSPRQSELEQENQRLQVLLHQTTSELLQVKAGQQPEERHEQHAQATAAEEDQAEEDQAITTTTIEVTLAQDSPAALQSGAQPTAMTVEVADSAAQVDAEDARLHADWAAVRQAEILEAKTASAQQAAQRKQERWQRVVASAQRSAATLQAEQARLRQQQQQLSSSVSECSGPAQQAAQLEQQARQQLELRQAELAAAPAAQRPELQAAFEDQRDQVAVLASQSAALAARLARRQQRLARAEASLQALEQPLQAALQRLEGAQAELAGSSVVAQEARGAHEHAAQQHLHARQKLSASLGEARLASPGLRLLLAAETERDPVPAVPPVTATGVQEAAQEAAEDHVATKELWRQQATQLDEDVQHLEQSLEQAEARVSVLQRQKGKMHTALRARAEDLRRGAINLNKAKATQKHLLSLVNAQVTRGKEVCDGVMKEEVI